MATDSLNDQGLDAGAGDAMDWLMDEDGDIAIVGGDFALVRGDAGVRQEAAIRLSWWLGEWFLDLTAGVDYEGRVLTKPPNIPQAQSTIRAELRKVTRVRSVQDVSVDLDMQTRNVSMEYAVTLLNGDTINGNILTG